MAIQADNLGDLIFATLKDLGEMKITEIATDLQNHVAMRNLLKENRVQIESGYGIQWDVMTTQSGAANFVGLYATDNVNVNDVLTQASAPWRHSNTSYAIDARELSMNTGARRIVDLLKIRRLDAMISMAELMENAFWSFPAATDTLTPYGVAYWIVKNATAGFTGGAQTGYTTVGGLNPTTYPRWKNYAAPYTAVTKDDLIRAWRKAATLTNFQPVVDNTPTFNTGDKFGYYANYATVAPLEENLEGQNDNLGNDIASKDGLVMFRRVPLMYVSKLDTDTTNPVYGVNWGVFKSYILRGWWLKEVSIDKVPGQHTVSAVHVDSSLNWICKDRRRCFVLSNGTSYPS